MVDRQDIDALLIGSLYGELSSAEEARLTAHLESHPADRTALADLTHARNVVRESRILQVHFEPPQQISALLMQEAARRAPKPREEQSWFQRFMRSFVAHPAMAAAMMLVVVVGVAGTIYLKQGDHFAKQTADDPAMMQPQSPSESPAIVAGADAAAAEVAADPARVNTGSAATEDYRVTLDGTLENKPADKVVVDDFSKSNAKQEAQKASEEPRRREAEKAKGELAFSDSKLGKEQAADKPVTPKPEPVAKAAPKSKKPTKPYIEVTTPDQAPKDFESSRTATVDRSGAAANKADLAEGKTTTVAGAGGTARNVAKPPADKAPAQPGSVAQPPPAATPVEERPQQEKTDPLLAWAKEQHAKVIAQVKAGKCDVAAPIAVQIANRHPSYFKSNVANDITIKGCMAHINHQRELEAERANRAKATQRRAADEAPSPAPKETAK